MNKSEIQPLQTPLTGGISRRSLLAGAAVLGAVATKSAQAAAPSAFAYVGTYTGGPLEQRGNNGQGIYLYDVNLNSGKLTLVKLAATTSSPSWLALHPSGNYLYANNEISNYNGTTSGSISAWRIERSNGDLTFLNTVSSSGAGPAFMSVDPLGQFVFAANYGGGSFAVIALNADGSLGNTTFTQQDVGNVGPPMATNAPSGSFLINQGHDAPHVHMIQTDPAGKYVINTDLGQDRIYVWLLNRSNGTLTPAATPWVNVPPGDGPRHFAFHPNGVWFYSLQEEASTVIFWTYDPGTGGLTMQQMYSALPPTFAGTSIASEIRVSSDGQFLYFANRNHDSTAYFSINGDGSLNYIGEAPTRNDYPRSFNIDPTGNFLYSCNQDADSITTFRINPATGVLTFTGQYTGVGTPASIVFLL